MEFKLSSPAFNSGSLIPSRYTCDGENINPHLVIHGVPTATKSLALLMANPDATGGTLVHWVMWNIPVETREIREHVVPFGAEEGTNGWGEVGYAGPCPSSGTHRYLFRLIAVDRKLHLPPGTSGADLEEAMAGHILATAELVGTYARTNEGPL